jgi:hypothetical protein
MSETPPPTEFKVTAEFDITATSGDNATAIVYALLSPLTDLALLGFQVTEVQAVTIPDAFGGVVLGTHESPGRG